MGECRIADYDKIVELAVNERFRRPNYRTVSEHDGLTWQGSQQQVVIFPCSIACLTCQKCMLTNVRLFSESLSYNTKLMSITDVQQINMCDLQVALPAFFILLLDSSVHSEVHVIINFMCRTGGPC